VLPETALVTPRLRMEVGPAMPRVGWTVRSPLGWRAPPAQRMAPWLDSVAPSKLIEKPGARAERWPAEQPGVR
jgi:hypothetical protein